ncbi:DNA-binding protein [Bacteroidia bacterium]|nr:DNA-binding protein [Bacteroidia bacterium]
MYVHDDFFTAWMEKLSKKLNEMGKDLKSLVNTNEVFDKDEKPLDNQDLCQLLHVSHRTLQRYRSDGSLPFHKRGQKIYYKLSDVRNFVYKTGDPWDKKEFEEKMTARNGE